MLLESILDAPLFFGVDISGFSLNTVSFRPTSEGLDTLSLRLGLRALSLRNMRATGLSILPTDTECGARNRQFPKDSIGFKCFCRYTFFWRVNRPREIDIG